VGLGVLEDVPGRRLAVAQELAEGVGAVGLSCGSDPRRQPGVSGALVRAGLQVR